MVYLRNSSLLAFWIFIVSSFAVFAADKDALETQFVSLVGRPPIVIHIFPNNPPEIRHNASFDEYDTDLITAYSEEKDYSEHGSYDTESEPEINDMEDYYIR